MYFLIKKNVGISTYLPVTVLQYNIIVIRGHNLHDFNFYDPIYGQFFNVSCAVEKNVSFVVKSIYLSCALLQMC